MTKLKTRRLTQVERSLRSREKLIDACIQLAAEKGAPSLTFDEIGERSGFSRNLAFQKFGSKAALLAAVIDHLHKVVADARDAADINRLSGLDALLLFCETHFIMKNDVDVMRAYSVLLSAAVAEHSDHLHLYERSHKRNELLLRKLLKQGIADGSVKPETNTSQAALLIGSLLLGMGTHSIVDPKYDIKKAMRELKRTIRTSYGTA